MKKVVLITLLLMFLMGGCIYQGELRPKPDDEEVWICESPYAELYWGKSKQCGKIIVDDIVYEIVFTTTSTPKLTVFEKEMKKERENIVDYDYCLFSGRTAYEKETAIVEVEKDFKNIFNGELPTLKFKRYTKEEYLKNKEE